MKKTITVSIPEDWKEVPFTKYLRFIETIRDSEDDHELVLAVALQHLCNLSIRDQKSISKAKYTEIATELSQLLAKQDEAQLIKSFTIDGVEYAIDPNIENISYGAYLDLVAYGKELWSNIPYICAVLYRPVVGKVKEHYSIESYKGATDEQADMFRAFLTMDIVNGLISFFQHSERELLNSSLRSFLEKMSKDQTLVQKGTSQASGQDMQVLLRLAEKISQKLMK